MNSSTSVIDRLNGPAFSIFRLVTAAAQIPASRGASGELLGNIGANTGIAASTASIQTCRVKVHLMEFAVRINEQSIFMGQNDFPGPIFA